MLRRMISRWRSGNRRAALVLYTRADCPLCDEMKAEIHRARVDIPFDLEEIDIDRDPDLTDRFGRSIPVLEIEGRIAFKGRLTAEEFERKLARFVRATG